VHESAIVEREQAEGEERGENVWGEDFPEWGRFCRRRWRLGFTIEEGCCFVVDSGVLWASPEKA